MIATVGASWLARQLEDSATNTILLDTRTVEEYSGGRVLSSVHINCPELIFKRLRKGKLSMNKLLNAEEDRAKYSSARTCEDVVVVVYDQSSQDWQQLPENSMAAAILNKTSLECLQVKFLEGGFELFHRLHSNLCSFSSCEAVCRRPSFCLQLNQAPLVPPSNPISITRHSSSPENSSKTLHKPFEILSHLYLGNEGVAKCRSALDNNFITRILNVTSHLPNYFEQEGLLYKKIPVEDRVDVDMMQHLEGALQFIEETRLRGEKILVHCHAGRSRSATVILAYLVKFYNYSLFGALEFLQQCKPDVDPNLGFMRQLLAYEKSTCRPSPTDSGLGSSPMEDHYFMPSPPASPSYALPLPISFNMDTCDVSIATSNLSLLTS